MFLASIFFQNDFFQKYLSETPSVNVKQFGSRSGPEVIKLFSCSTQLSTKFQLLIKTKIPTNKEVSCFKSLRCCIYHANKSRMNFVLS